MCQELWQLVGSKKRYCNNKQAYFFAPPPHVLGEKDILLKYSANKNLAIPCKRLQANVAE